MEEDSQITPWVLEKAVLALSHVMDFFWGRIWSEGLGEDRVTSKMSVIDDTSLILKRSSGPLPALLFADALCPEDCGRGPSGAVSKRGTSVSCLFTFGEAGLHV